MAAKCLLFTAVFYFITSSTFVQSEIFTALSHVERLVNIEMELTDTLEEYLIEQESRLNKLRSFFQDLKLAMDQAKHNREAYIGHPMNTYLMIKRLVNEWRSHVKAIQEEGDAEGKPVNSSKIRLLYGQLHRSSADKRKKKKTGKTKFNLAIEVSSVKALKEYP